MTRFAIVGDGPWGQALAHRIASNGHVVRLVGRPGPAPTPSGRGSGAGRRFPAGISHTTDLPAALGDHELLLLAVPITALEELLRTAAPHLEGHHRVVTAVRGLAPGELPRRATELVQVMTCIRQTAVLAGAADAVALGTDHPAALVVGSAFPALAREVQSTLAGPTLRVYTNEDPAGVELANMLAAVMAVALGAARALGAGAAAEATALTRALAEMERVVQKLGGQAGTAYGLAGLGVLTDLVFHGDGQAFETGAYLARGDVEAAGHNVELSEAARNLATRARSVGARAPLLEAIAGLFAGTLTAREALTTLMTRTARAE